LARKQSRRDEVKRGGCGLRGLVTLLILAVVAGFGWHVVQALEADDRVRSLLSTKGSGDPGHGINVNPLTNLVTVTLADPTANADRPFAAITNAFTQLAGPGVLERELNDEARANYDFYAIAIPYRVRIIPWKAPDDADPDRLR